MDITPHCNHDIEHDKGEQVAGDAAMADESAAQTMAAHAAAAALAAERAADASLAIVRSVVYAVLWFVGGLALAIVADSLPWGLNKQSWIRGAVLLPMVAIGFELGRRARPRTRRRAAVIVAFVIGLFAGYAMDRTGGAILTAPIAAGSVFVVHLLIDALAPRLSPLWRLRLIWGAWACLISTAMVAGVTRLVIGKFDDDDFPFYVMAGAVAIFLAVQHGWFIDGNLTLANMLRRFKDVAAALLHRRIAPFILAMIMAFLIAGPMTHQLNITEGDVVTIASAATSLVWPACFAGAAVLALVLSLGSPAPVFRKVMAILALLCIHSLINVAVFSARFDDQTVEARTSIWNSYAFKRDDVTRITYERRTARRSVQHHAIIHQTNGRTINIGSDILSWRAVEWMRDKWGVQEEKWR